MKAEIWEAILICLIFAAFGFVFSLIFRFIELLSE